jgi:hypothetical protein
MKGIAFGDAKANYKARRLCAGRTSLDIFDEGIWTSGRGKQALSHALPVPLGFPQRNYSICVCL